RSRVVFFFQAEDGIRDKLVTGVQTCALPIYEAAVGLAREHGLSDAGDDQRVDDAREHRQHCQQDERGTDVCGHVWAPFTPDPARSEERRVGKECRCRGATDRLKEETLSTECV